MFTNKRNILQLAALLKEHNVQKVVVCPGSRDMPIARTLANNPFFSCYPMTDERGAGFFAIGLAISTAQTVAVVCTSGSALLNLHPAVAEAFYQKVPIVVISADRPQAWIGQMDGQTIPQPDVFGQLVKMSVSLPEVNSDEDEWYCNRLINEVLLETNHHGKGPVHINVPISEPFFDMPQTELPKVRVITRYQGLNVYDRDYNQLIDRLKKYDKRLFVVGQMNLIYLFDKKYSKMLYKHFAWLTEHIGNRTVPGMAIKNFDSILYAAGDKEKSDLVPDLVITCGGHIVSKRLKRFLRENPPKEHWHVSPGGEVADVFGSLTTVVEMDPFEFMEKIAYLLDNKSSDYPKRWERLSKKIDAPQFAYSEMSAIGLLMNKLPAPCALHLANSSTIRYAQLFDVKEDVEVCCNRGTNGIEGSLSTAIGYSVASDKLNFAVIGDLSFFYDMNALWNGNYGCNVRIMLLNNGGGEIFDTLPGLNLDEKARSIVSGTHKTSAEGWAKERGFEYLSVNNDNELLEAMERFASPDPYPRPMLLEVFTDRDEDVRLLKEYYHGLKGHI